MAGISTAQKLAWLERIAQDQNITHLQFRVAFQLSTYLNRTSGDAWPSQTLLAADLGVTTRAVQLAIDALAAAGYLEVEASRGRGHTNHYRPILDNEKANEDAPVEQQKDEPGCAISTDKRRTAVPEKANGGSVKGERPFVQNPFKRTLLKNPKRESARAIEIEEGQAMTSWPENFQLTPNLINYAISKNVTQVDEVFERFRNHHRAKGSRFKDWEYAWRSWIDKEARFNPPDLSQVYDHRL